MKPDPIVIAWHGGKVRVRHDDPRLTPYSLGASRLHSAVELASDADGLRLVLETTMGDRYRLGCAMTGRSWGCGGAARPYGRA